MSDLISREAAIQALCEGALINYNATGDNYGMVKAINVIKALPSAEPDSETGKRYYRIHGTFDILIDTDPMADQEQTRNDPE